MDLKKTWLHEICRYLPICQQAKICKFRTTMVFIQLLPNKKWTLELESLGLLSVLDNLGEAFTILDGSTFQPIQRKISKKLGWKMRLSNQLDKNVLQTCELLLLSLFTPGNATEKPRNDVKWQASTSSFGRLKYLFFNV